MYLAFCLTSGKITFAHLERQAERMTLDSQKISFLLIFLSTSLALIDMVTRFSYWRKETCVKIGTGKYLCENNIPFF